MEQLLFPNLWYRVTKDKNSKTTVRNVYCPFPYIHDSINCKLVSSLDKSLYKPSQDSRQETQLTPEEFQVVFTVLSFVNIPAYKFSLYFVFMRYKIKNIIEPASFFQYSWDIYKEMMNNDKENHCPRRRFIVGKV